MTTAEYLTQPVLYGGQTVTRGERLADLQRLAREIHPDSPTKQAALVNAYLAGADR